MGADHEPRVALIGYGQFGRAFADRLLDSGAHVRAFDRFADGAAEDLLAPSLAEAVAGAGFVVLAVPVSAYGPVLTELRPLLRADQLVLDVGSVKTGPVEVMGRILGDEIPWLATHPLFGPTSLMRGELPLRVVICPQPVHPGAFERGASLFTGIGCEILERDAESHDREMAEGHALAYFVAKGFLDGEIELDLTIAPPSVQAIARTIRAAREDSAHLFASLHRENPFAGAARRRLLDALQRVDGALRAAPPKDEEPHHETGALHLDELTGTPAELSAARDVIDEIDSELLTLLARRAEVALRAAHAKAQVGRAVRDPRRESELLEARREAAGALHLDEEAVARVFAAILEFSRDHQNRRS